MRCPACGDDYEPDVSVCAACDVALGTAQTTSSARVGRFHPAAARAVAELAIRRGAAVQTSVVSGRVDVLVPKERRDALRAELLLTWDALLAGLPPDDQAQLRELGGQLPGWDDTPDGVWVDRDGQLRVARAEEEEIEEDAGRSVGPALVAVAVILLLSAWQIGDGHLRLLAAVTGLGLLLVGTFLPY
ncbi:MAG: hypothetical protein M3252_08240 [Actinomycetota bacterium]|nr:hypothetical protein [Actinomycetota bacterium]